MIRLLFKLVTRTRLWDWFLSHPMAHLKLRIWKYPSFDMKKYHECCRIIKEEPGHYVFVGRDRSSFSFLINNLISGAKWAHAGLVLPYDGTPPKILHSIVTGVCVWDLLDYLREVDDFMLIKLTLKNELAEAEADRRLMWMLNNAIGMPYDNGFDLGDRKSYYCSELVYARYEDLVDDPNFNPELIAEMPFFTPDNTAEVGYVALS